MAAPPPAVTWTTVEAAITTAMATAAALRAQFLKDGNGNIITTQGPGGTTPILVNPPAAAAHDPLSLGYVMTNQIAAVKAQFDALRKSLGG